MAVAIRPEQGGFLRPFGCVIEFLKGNAPEGRRRLDPEVGAPMVDILAEYKTALLRAFARDAVEREEEKRIKKGQGTFTEEEYTERLEYYFSRIPYKFTRMRYSSFTRYMGHLKRLGWLEETGETEASGLQDDYPPAPSRVFYRLTEDGWKATPDEISNPVRALYPKFDKEYFREKNRQHQYYILQRTVNSNLSIWPSNDIASVFVSSSPSAFRISFSPKHQFSPPREE